MSRSKGFLGHLFSRSSQRSDETSSALTPSQRVELLNTLKAEYGIEIMQANLSGTDLMQNGYRKMNSDELAKASMVLQYIPQFVALTANNQVVGTTFKAATENTFRAVISPGTHLAFSKLNSGAFRGLVYSDSSNRLVTHAEFFANNASLTIPKAPQIALSVFSALSLATGQYFMTQINGKLEAITGGIDRIEQFLENSRRSELMAACQELNEQTARIEYIGSEHDAAEIITHLDNIRMAVRKHISHYQTQIHASLSEMHEKDNMNDIDKKIQTTTTYLREYRYAVQVVTMTKLLELRIKNIIDPKQMAMYRQEISECIEQYKADYLIAEQACIDYLEHSRVLNKKSVQQKIAVGVGFVTDAFIGIKSNSPFQNKTILGSTVNDLFEENRIKKKTLSAEKTKGYFTSIGSIEELNTPINAIDRFIEALMQPIGIVCVEGEYYTNLPCSEAQ